MLGSVSDREQYTHLPFSPDEVRSQLERVLASPPFRNSPRCQSLLRYVVDSACSGQLDVLKERVIGNKVFGREPDYDTNQDAVVRNAAAEVRKRLAQYYQECSRDGEIRIELPCGSYAPEFHPSHSPVAAPLPADNKLRRVPWLTVIFALIATAALAGWLLEWRHNQPPAVTDLDRFWAPTLAAPNAVQICVGQSKRKYLPKPLPPAMKEESDPKATISAAMLEPMRDRFLWMGDSMCMARISGYLAAHNKTYRLRGAQVTGYSELRGNAVISIGAFNNEWTMRLTEGARFSLVNGGDSALSGVRDRDQGSQLVWTVSHHPHDWITEEDYAVITRLFDPHTEQPVVTAGGITHYGTMATGDFLTNPAYFREALRAAPSDWFKKNMQVVLRTKISEGAPGPPRVLAVHFWDSGRN